MKTNSNNRMATLKVSLSGTAAPTSSPSPSLKSWPHISDSPPKISVVVRFPNATVLSPPKLRLQASPGKKPELQPLQLWQPVLPPALTSTSDPPPIFDGNTRLYISCECPYAQRPWIARNCKGWRKRYNWFLLICKTRQANKEKVYLANKVPPLKHKNEVKGESLDLIGYIDDSHFEGPSLFPEDPGKKEFGEELLSYIDSFNRSVFSSVKQDEIESADWTFDYIETALSKFEDGPFFLGKFSLVDIAYAPFLERFQLSLTDLKKYDIAAGRPKLATCCKKIIMA